MAERFNKINYGQNKGLRRKNALGNNRSTRVYTVLRVPKKEVTLVLSILRKIFSAK